MNFYILDDSEDSGGNKFEKLRFFLEHDFKNFYYRDVQPQKADKKIPSYESPYDPDYGKNGEFQL